MLQKSSQSILLVLVSVIALFASHSDSFPLSTHKRWIIDEATGHRVKLTCVNWATHLQPMLAEGLDKQPLEHIVKHVVDQKFTCVRLTWATHMFTRYANQSVSYTLDSLDLQEVKENINKNNPFILKMNHVQAYEAVVDELGKQGVMVLIDNHVSHPNWCCNDDDDNGFFGDRHFNAKEWLQGLHLIAKHFHGKSEVVAIDLRNELHGPRQNERDWYNYVHQGAKTIHKANPDVLVLISGLNYDTDFTFLKKKPLKLNLNNKLVYESHLYSWSGVGTVKMGEVWTAQPVNRICAQTLQGVEERSGFLNEGNHQAPLFFTEFGLDVTAGGDDIGNRFLTCFMSYIVGRDLDWGLWALQGSYYLREGKLAVEESFGLLDANFQQIKYQELPQKFQLLQKKIQDPTSKLPKSYIMFHPQSGQCVQAKNSGLELGNCEQSSLWDHAGDGAPIMLKGKSTCLKAVGDGLAPTLSSDCKSDQPSSWKFVSMSHLHLATLDQQGQLLCLDKESSNSTKIVTNKCICIEDDSECLDNPQSQWFTFATTNLA